MRAKSLLRVLIVIYGCNGDGDRVTDDPMMVDAGSMDLDSGPEQDAEAPPEDTGTQTDSGGATDASTTNPPMGSGGEHSSYRPDAFEASDATRLVIMGDSIAAGFGLMWRRHIAGHLLAENDDERWPESSDLDLESFLGSTVEVVDVSANGATTTSVATSQLPQVDSMLPGPVSGKTLVMVIAGGNDLQASIVGGNPTGSVLTNALDRLRMLHTFFADAERFPDGVEMMVMDVYDPSDGEAQIPGCFFNLRLPTFVEALDVWRDRFIELGTELGFAVIDALGHFHGHAHHYDNADNPFYDPVDTSFWFSDCIHPNERGHHEIRRLFYEIVDPAYEI